MRRNLRRRRPLQHDTRVHLAAAVMPSGEHSEVPDFIDLWRAEQIHQILLRYGWFAGPEVERTPGFRELAAARDRQIAAVEFEALRRKDIAADAGRALANVWKTPGR
jgi:hypothetical protein